MSSRSNSDSEEEDVEDMLARITKNLNNHDSGSEDEGSGNENHSDKRKSSEEKGEEEDDEDVDEENKSDDEDHSENKQPSKQSETEQASATQSIQQGDKQSDMQEQLQSSDINKHDKENDEQTEPGLNINNILIQNGIPVDPQESISPNTIKQSQKQSEQNQSSPIKIPKLIKESSSSVDKSSPTKKQQPQSGEINTPTQTQEETGNQQKENIFTVVREGAEKKEEVVDHLLQDLRNIKIKKAILEDPEILNFKLDSGPLEQTIEQVKKRYDENVGKYMVKQKYVFDRIKEINKRSVGIYDQVNSSNKTFLKKKVSDKEKCVKEIQKLQSETNKTKTFLIMMIQRLESIELDIDKLADTKMKEINRKNEISLQNQQQQQEQQQQQQQLQQQQQQQQQQLQDTNAQQANNN